VGGFVLPAIKDDPLDRPIRILNPCHNLRVIELLPPGLFLKLFEPILCVGD
jgi:hypothetical protein